jgi:hypothetical protein
VATILTGLYPPRHGAFGEHDRLSPALPYLPAILAAAGRHTGAVVGMANVGATFGFDRGYAEFAGFRAAKPDARAIVERVTRMLPRLAPPFFLYVHLVDPHDPYAPEKPWGRAPGEGRPYVQPQWFEVRGEMLGAAALARMRDQYDGEIAEMDAQIAVLLARLDAAGLLDDTLVAFTADHGEEFGEHGGLRHGRTLFEESLRVPFVLWARSGLPARAGREPFHLVDFTPTVLDALGVPAPPGLDGRSRWRELVTGDLRPSGPLFFHLDLGEHAALAILDPPYKLIVGNPLRRSRLLRVGRDPAEPRRMVGAPALRARLTDALFEWVVAESRQRPAPGAVDVPPDVISRLEKLGYLRGSPLRDVLLPRASDVRNVIDLRGGAVQLFRGRVATDDTGAWVGPDARLVLAAEPTARAIRLRGVAPGAATCAVTVDGVRGRPLVVGKGPVDVRVPIPEPVRGRPLVYADVEVRPARTVPGVEAPIGLHWSRVETVAQ